MLAPRRGFDHIRDGGSNIQHQHQRLLDQECGRPHPPHPQPTMLPVLCLADFSPLSAINSTFMLRCDGSSQQSTAAGAKGKEKKASFRLQSALLYIDASPSQGLLSFLSHRSLNQHILLYIFVFIRSSNMLEAFSLFHFLSLPPLDTDITELTFRTN